MCADVINLSPDDVEEEEYVPKDFNDVGVNLTDFYAYMQMHNYIFAPARDPWPAVSINARFSPIPLVDQFGQPVRDQNGKPKFIKASTWLDKHRPVEQMTWAPGQPMLIRGRLVADGGWIERKGVTCFNLYRPPIIQPGNPSDVEPWLAHLRRIFPEEEQHIRFWLAHRLQFPAVKINHALVLSGLQGIGKDTLLEPVKYGVGPSNFHEVSPQQILGRFNGFLKSVVLRVSETRDLGEHTRFELYDHMKAYIAAPPDVLRVDEKNLREYQILNCCGVCITTNHKADGIYLPADDRRHYVAWSRLTKEDFDKPYWNRLWGWYANGGIWNVVAYLSQLDIDDFDAKAPPPKTEAFWDIVSAHRAPEEAETADVLDLMDRPDVFLLADLKANSDGDFSIWLSDRRNQRIIPHRLEQCGYVTVRNEEAADGRWQIRGIRHVVYGQAALSSRERQQKALQLIREKSDKGGPA
jgi:hypothetical protein